MATVTQLLSAGVEVDARAFHDHSTPLMTAAAMGNSDMVRFLVYQGATVDAMDMEARDALDIAMHSSHVDCVRVLLEMGATVESRGMIPRLFRFGLFIKDPSSLEIVRLLLKWGADVNVEEGPSGETPLARAVIFGAIELVMLLLNHGAAVNQAVTATGTTALHMAVSVDRVTLSRRLVEAGADIYAVDAVGRMTPLQFAVHIGCTEIVAMLNAVTASKEERRRTWTEPWSIQRHHTFRPAARQRVYTLSSWARASPSGSGARRTPYGRVEGARPARRDGDVGPVVGDAARLEGRGAACAQRWYSDGGSKLHRQ